MTTIANADPTTPTAVVRAYCDAWMAGDTMTVLSLYHDDLTLVWPGSHPLAGVHEGQTASIEALLALQAATGRRPIEILDVMTGDTAVMVTVVERWTREEDATTIELVRGLEYTVQDGQLRTCRLYETDQAAVDEWLTSSNAPDPTTTSDRPRNVGRSTLRP